MHSTHVAAQGLPRREVFVAGLAVERTRLDLCLVDSRLLRTLWLSNALASL